MNIKKLTITIASAMLLVACGDKPEVEKAEVEVIIFQDQLEALEKAKGVEQMLLDTEAKTKEELDQRGI
jgi:hypothetical protein